MNWFDGLILRSQNKDCMDTSFLERINLTTPVSTRIWTRLTYWKLGQVSVSKTLIALFLQPLLEPLRLFDKKQSSGVIHFICEIWNECPKMHPQSAWLHDCKSTNGQKSLKSHFRTVQEKEMALMHTVNFSKMDQKSRDSFDSIDFSLVNLFQIWLEQIVLCKF